MQNILLTWRLRSFFKRGLRELTPRRPIVLGCLNHSVFGGFDRKRTDIFTVHHTLMSTMATRYLKQTEAQKIDEELFNDYKFSVHQLMELAGLSVASVITSIYKNKIDKAVLVLCGPGNNGGDGLVAARHLKVFGFTDVSIVLSKKPSKQLYIELLKQAELNDIKISVDGLNRNTELIPDKVGIIVDALFGFSFKPPVRPEYVSLIDALKSGSENGIPVVSVDIPSGWDVETGPPNDKRYAFMPHTLVSLTAPKECARNFTGAHHYLGGRFVPQSLMNKYQLRLPSFPGTDCFVKID